MLLFVGLFGLNFHCVGFSAWLRSAWLADPDAAAALAAAGS